MRIQNRLQGPLCVPFADGKSKILTGGEIWLVPAGREKEKTITDYIRKGILAAAPEERLTAKARAKAAEPAE